MDIITNSVTDICEELLRSYQNGKHWLEGNLAPELKTSAQLEIKRLKREMERLRLASLQRPAIAVFGASQMGKSYLISNMVRSPQSSDLLIEDPQTKEKISFIKEMNPFGSKESTGTVTRFTTSPRFESSKGYAVRLLSPKDLICIICNGYYSDIQEHTYNISVEELSGQLNDLHNKKQKSPSGIFKDDDFQEVKEYLIKSLSLSNNVLVNRLIEFDFFSRVSEIAPYLSIKDSVELASHLWGKQEFLNDLFLRLLQGLQNTDFTYQVFCTKEALTSNTETILDVERLRELYVEGSTVASPVNITTQKGSTPIIDRRILAALTAEVELPLSITPEDQVDRAYLGYADVLDFPGARSREQIPESVFVSKSDEAKLQLFIRGKVAYLFDLYNQDYGISTLLYCMDNSNPEVVTLPQLLYQWIANSIGDNETERETRITKVKQLIPDTSFDISPLLVVLTKFDVELTGKPSEMEGKPESHNGKWEARFEVNFKKFMHLPLEDEWIHNWSQSNKNFKHIFPLYNPEFNNPIYQKDENNKYEIGITPAYKQKLSDMRTSFITHPTIQKHTINPSDLWEGIAPAGKTGLEYIIKYLTPTCRPEIKMELIKGAIKTVNQLAINLLEDYYNPEDIDQLLKKAKINGAKAIIHLTKTTSNNQFGPLLEKLMITENEVWACYYETQNSPALSLNNPDALLDNIPVSFVELLESFGINVTEAPDKIISQLKDRLGVSSDDLEEIIEGETGKPIDQVFGTGAQEERLAQDNAMIFVEKILSIWINKIQGLKRQNTPGGINTLSILIEELIKTRKRISLRSRLYHAVKEEVDNFAVNGKFDVVARIASQIINNFVGTFGWHFIPEDKRPKDNREFPIFSDTGVDPNKVIPNIDYQFPGERIFKDWSIGAREAFIQNVYFENKVKNPETAANNQKLGNIIKNLNQSCDAIQ